MLTSFLMTDSRADMRVVYGFYSLLGYDFCIISFLFENTTLGNYQCTVILLISLIKSSFFRHLFGQNLYNLILYCKTSLLYFLICPFMFFSQL